MRIPEVKGLYIDEKGALKRIEKAEYEKWAAASKNLKPIASVEEWEAEQMKNKGVKQDAD